MPRVAPSGTCADARRCVPCAAEDFIMRIAGFFLFLIIVALPLAADDAADFLKAVAGQDLATVKSMLARDPALANAHRPNGIGAVTVALFANKGEGFSDPAHNELLQTIEPHAKLDLFETAALGTAAQLEAMLADPPPFPTPPPSAWTLLPTPPSPATTPTT